PPPPAPRQTASSSSLTAANMSSISSYGVWLNARKLVPFLPPKPISPRRAKEQDASPLFRQLPPELRQMIWDTYFRGHAVHLFLPSPQTRMRGGKQLLKFYSSKRLRGKECLTWDPDFQHEWDLHRVLCCKPETEIPCDYMSLVLACKKTCSLPGDLVRLHVCKGALANLSKRLPAAHLASISRVNLSWILSHPLYFEGLKNGKNEVLWVATWEALAAMEGLEWLRVEVEIKMFYPREAEEYTEREYTLWELIKKVTRPSHFELILPFPAAESTREETLPCTIIRRIAPRNEE
ncbi:hypothetical protein ACCO45_012329, partial [Purpureocillium lilacinum]